MIGFRATEGTRPNIGTQHGASKACGDFFEPSRDLRNRLSGQGWQLAGTDSSDNFEIGVHSYLPKRTGFC
jgi:hypothetical protein